LPRAVFRNSKYGVARDVESQIRQVMAVC
jgi:hypothetical protein